MNKQTKMYLGVALVAVAGYMVFQKMKKDKAEAAKPAAPAPNLAFAGNVGQRKRMVGLLAANKEVSQSDWVRPVATGSASIAPTFFNVKNSGWGGRQ